MLDYIFQCETSPPPYFGSWSLYYRQVRSPVYKALAWSLWSLAPNVMTYLWYSPSPEGVLYYFRLLNVLPFSDTPPGTMPKRVEETVSRACEVISEATYPPYDYFFFVSTWSLVGSLYPSWGVYRLFWKTACWHQTIKQRRWMTRYSFRWRT